MLKSDKHFQKSSKVSIQKSVPFRVLIMDRLRKKEQESRSIITDSKNEITRNKVN
jgi:hypothetical protein